MALRPKIGPCELCSRQSHLTFHHLIPKKLHRRPAFRRKYSREVLNSGVALCRPCHSALHRFYDLMYLGKQLNTLEKLREDPKLVKHIEWMGRQRIQID